jgi:cytosine/adenosine deaminase-related metal-dependent hydrolase
MLAGGVAVGIGLDGHALDDDQDYLRELRLAWTLANRPGAESATLSAAVFLTAGTQSGAAITLGTDVPLGVLKPGALADLVLLDWEAVRGVWSSPLIDPLTLLLRRAQAGHVRHVMVNGAWRLRDGQATGLDEEAIAAALAEELARIDGAELAQRAAAARTLAPYLRHFYREFGA